MTAAQGTERLAVAPAQTSTIRRRLSRLALHGTLVTLMVIWLLPTIGLFVNSFRTSADIAASGWWTAIFPPTGLTLESYAKVLNQTDIGSGFINSLFITIPATIIPIFVAAFAAYAFSWMSFPFRNGLFVLVVALLVVPLQTTFIPILQAYGQLGIAGDFG